MPTLGCCQERLHAVASLPPSYPHSITTMLSKCHLVVGVGREAFVHINLSLHAVVCICFSYCSSNSSTMTHVLGGENEVVVETLGGRPHSEMPNNSDYASSLYRRNSNLPEDEESLESNNSEHRTVSYSYHKSTMQQKDQKIKELQQQLKKTQLGHQVFARRDTNPKVMSDDEEQLAFLVHGEFDDIDNKNDDNVPVFEEKEDAAGESICHSSSWPSSQLNASQQQDLSKMLEDREKTLKDKERTLRSKEKELQKERDEKKELSRQVEYLRKKQTTPGKSKMDEMMHIKLNHTLGKCKNLEKVRLL